MFQKVLYLTYDGINDPLGKSQITPYLSLIKKKTEKLILISFEKEKKKPFIFDEKIEHIMLKFTSNLGKFGKIYDMIKFSFVMIKVLSKNKVNVVHARSHIPAYFAFFFKFFFNYKFYFDFRGLWIDEKIESRNWNNFFFTQIIIPFFRILEIYSLSKADKIIVLTNKIKKILFDKYKFINNKAIYVLPCVNNFKINLNKNDQLKKKIGLKKIVFCYVGSFGGIYDPIKVIEIFKSIKKNFLNSSLLILTNNISYYDFKMKEYRKFFYKGDIKVLSIDHNKIKNYLSVVDIGINYIKNGYARNAQSPTRIGEFLMCGIPIITNSNIGDIDEILRKTKGGYVNQKQFKFFSFNKTLILKLLKTNKKKLIFDSKKYYSFKKAEQVYSKLYS